MLPQIKSLDDARGYLRNHWEDGCECPACHQHVQLYKRKLNSGMACTLIYIYREDNHLSKWIQVKEFLREQKYRNNHDWTLLRYWNLLEEKPKEENDDVRNSGCWRITEKGRDFVEGTITVAKHIYLYNGKKYKPTATVELTTIRQALGDHFSYEELMSF